MKLSVFSFFAGAGFLDLGFENAGFDIEFVNEAYAPFLGGYRHARFNMMNKNLTQPKYGYHLCSVEDFLDGRSSNLKAYVDEAKHQGLVGFIGGPPCPDFSVAGRNAGGSGKYGNLSQVYIDLICQQEPDFFLLENVKGLISTKAHKAFFDSLISQLRLNGYVVDWRILNSIEYGTPQDRERVIMVGFKYKSFGIPNTKVKFYPWEASTLYYPPLVLNPKKWPNTNKFFANGHINFSLEFPELTVQHWFNRNDVLIHPNAEDYFTPKSPKIWEIDEGDVSRKCFKRLHRWRYSPTACYGNNEVHLHPYKARRLSVAEALAIQSLPKDFSLPIHGMSLTDKFKTIGNGVPYLMAKGIAESIKEYLFAII